MSQTFEINEAIRIVIQKKFPDKKDYKYVIQELEKIKQHYSSKIDDRIFAAILKLSDNMDTFREAIKVTKADWRDVLMYAGFGNDIHLHKKWIVENSVK